LRGNTRGLSLERFLQQKSSLERSTYSTKASKKSQLVIGLIVSSKLENAVVDEK
jgi:hypothetical protein